MTNKNEKMMVEKRNKNLLDMLINKIENEYRNDVDFIGFTGSCMSGDYDKYSDLDLVIVKSDDSDKWFNMCFINQYDDIEIGYDFYTMDWNGITNKVGSTWASHIIDVEPVWYASDEVKNRWADLKKKAEDNVNSPITEEKINNAEGNLNNAKMYFMQLMMVDETEFKKTLLSAMIMELTDVICLLNNTYYRYGIKQRIQEIEKMKYPENFVELYNKAINAVSVDDITKTAQSILKVTNKYFETIKNDVVNKSVINEPVQYNDPIYGAYEELVSNYGNKVVRCIESNDIQAACLTTCCIQGYINERAEEAGMPEFNISKYLDLNDLSKLAEGFKKLAETYLKEYEKQGVKVDIRSIK